MANISPLTLGIGKAVDGQDVWVLCQVGESCVLIAIADHEVDGDKTFQDDGPGGLPEPEDKRAEDFGDAMLSGMSCDKKMLDVFCLRGSSLAKGNHAGEGGREVICKVSGLSLRLTLKSRGEQTFILVAPFTDFSNELAMTKIRSLDSDVPDRSCRSAS